MKTGSLYKKIKDSGLSLVVGYLNKYGCQYSLRDLCDCIETKTDTNLVDFLKQLDECGAVDILTAICIFVECTDDEEIKNWFYNTCLSGCSMSYLVKSLKDGYIDYRRETFYIPGFDARLFDSIASFESFISENIDKDYLDSIESLSHKHIGIWLPTIYSKTLTTDYFSKLEHSVFPILSMIANDIKNSNRKNDVLFAIIINTIKTYVSELVLRLNSLLDSIGIELINENACNVANSNSGYFRSLINGYCSDNILVNIVTDNMFRYIEDFLSVLEYFGFLDTLSDYLFKKLRPFLYEMIDRNMLAYEALLKQIMSNEPYIFSDWSVLIALYRCLLVVDEEKRNKLISFFDNKLLPQYFFDDLLKLVEDVEVFFRNYTKRVNDDIAQGDPFLYFDDGIARSYVIKNWICSGLISKTFHNIYEKLDEKLEKKCVPVEKYVNVIKSFVMLFYGLSSHYDGEIRIDFNSVARVLEETQSIGSNFKNSEIFFIYTSEEQATICRFVKRLKKLQEMIPSESYINVYTFIKKKVFEYLKSDNETILCDKLLQAIGEIQTNSYDIDVETFYNNQLAIFLRGYYGVTEVHREKPQGSSQSGTGQGETDILIYRNEYQFALIESIRLIEFAKDKIYGHLARLIQNYDTQGVAVNCLLIFVIQKNDDGWFNKVENCLNEYKFPYNILEPVKRIESKLQKTCHHVIKYTIEGSEKHLHVFTALIDPVVRLQKNKNKCQIIDSETVSE